MRRAALVIACASMLAGCGGAAPLLHPAQVLPAGDVRGEAGIAARAVVGGLGDQLRQATNESVAQQQTGNGTITVDVPYAQGALVAAAMAPDLSPVAGARVGVGASFEGGIMYTGRGARIDLRRAFRLGPASPWALSVGLGLDGTFAGRQNIEIAGVDGENLFGFGADVPLLLGWKSTAGLYHAWIGARVSYEHDTIETRSSAPLPGTLPPPDLVGDRVAVGGLVGVAIGFRHVHVALEIEADYAYIGGSFGGVPAHVDGLSLTPASAVWIDF